MTRLWTFLLLHRPRSGPEEGERDDQRVWRRAQLHALSQHVRCQAGRYASLCTCSPHDVIIISLSAPFLLPLPNTQSLILYTYFAVIILFSHPNYSQNYSHVSSVFCCELFGSILASVYSYWKSSGLMQVSCKHLISVDVVNIVTAIDWLHSI